MLPLTGPLAGGRSAVLDQPLTPREIEVLTLLAEGASNKAIARRLGISVHTAKFHVGQLSTSSTPPAVQTPSRTPRGLVSSISEDDPPADVEDEDNRATEARSTSTLASWVRSPSVQRSPLMQRAPCRRGHLLDPIYVSDNGPSVDWRIGSSPRTRLRAAGSAHLCSQQSGSESRASRAGRSLRLCRKSTMTTASAPSTNTTKC